jgi:hypothetical protein
MSDPCEHYVAAEDWGSENCSGCGERIACDDCGWFTACLATGGCIKKRNEQAAAEGELQPCSKCGHGNRLNGKIIHAYGCANADS